MAATKLLLLLFSVTLLGLSSAQSQDDEASIFEDSATLEQDIEELSDIEESFETQSEEQEAVAKPNKNVFGKPQDGKKNRSGKRGPPTPPGDDIKRNSGPGGRSGGGRGGGKPGRRPDGQEGSQRGGRSGGFDRSRPRRQ